MRKLLFDLGLTRTEVNELMIQSRNSELIVNVFEILSTETCNKKIICKLISLISKNDEKKILSVNVETLSIILGLTIRQINSLRKNGKIPFIKLSGPDEGKAGRKTYLYEINKVKEALNINE